MPRQNIYVLTWLSRTKCTLYECKFSKRRVRFYYIKAYLSKNITVSTIMTQWTFLILPVNAFTKV